MSRQQRDELFHRSGLRRFYADIDTFFTVKVGNCYNPINQLTLQAYRIIVHVQHRFNIINPLFSKSETSRLATRFDVQQIENKKIVISKIQGLRNLYYP